MYTNSMDTLGCLVLVALISVGIGAVLEYVREQARFSRRQKLVDEFKREYGDDYRHKLREYDSEQRKRRIKKRAEEIKRKYNLN